MKLYYLSPSICTNKHDVTCSSWAIQYISLFISTTWNRENVTYYHLTVFFHLARRRLCLFTKLFTVKGFYALQRKTFFNNSSFKSIISALIWRKTMYNGIHTKITATKYSEVQAIMTANFRVKPLQLYRVKSPTTSVIVKETGECWSVMAWWPSIGVKKFSLSLPCEIKCNPVWSGFFTCVHIANEQGWVGWSTCRKFVWGIDSLKNASHMFKINASCMVSILVVINAQNFSVFVVFNHFQLLNSSHLRRYWCYCGWVVDSNLLWFTSKCPAIVCQDRTVYSQTCYTSAVSLTSHLIVLLSDDVRTNSLCIKEVAGIFWNNYDQDTFWLVPININERDARSA